MSEFFYKEKLTSFISTDSSKILRAGEYEKVLLAVLNKSKIVFPYEYKHFEKQPNGEPDYQLVNGNDKFDIKLLMTKQQGQDLLSDNVNVCRHYNRNI